MNFVAELNVRHQDIVNAIVTRLKEIHIQEMEECMAKAITDTVLKVEVVRLEVESEFERKFSELYKNSENEINMVKKMNEEEIKNLEEMYNKEIKQREEAENQLKNISFELREQHEKNLAEQLATIQERLKIEHEESIEQSKKVSFIESGYSIVLR